MVIREATTHMATQGSTVILPVMLPVQEMLHLQIIAGPIAV
jgi:hypothetical protein